MRQRLANTLFAQIFSGSPNERYGWLRRLLRAMAWLTLGVAPVFVILFLQFVFLPYHSHSITWVLRTLVVFELVVVLVLWGETLSPGWYSSWRLVRRNWLWLLLAFAIVFVSWIGLTFPGEVHSQWTRYLPETRHRRRS